MVFMKSFFSPMEELGSFQEILKELQNYKGAIEVSGLVFTQKVHLALSVLHHTRKRAFFVANNQLAAQKVYEDFLFFNKNEVFFLPDMDIVLHSLSAESTEIHFQRLEGLHRLFTGDFKIIVTSSGALLKKMMSKDRFRKSILTLNLSISIDPIQIAQQFVMMGYEKNTLVEGKGQFAIRGGIIDVFPVNERLPVRIELFGDEVDSIRTFDLVTQRSIQSLDSIDIIPAREFLYFPEERKSIVCGIEEELKKTVGKKPKENIGSREELIRVVESDLERLENQYYFAGMEKYVTAFPEANASILDFIDKEDILMIDEPQKFNSKIETTWVEFEEHCKDLMARGSLLPFSMEALFRREEVLEKMAFSNLVYLNTISVGTKDYEVAKKIHVAGKSIPGYSGKLDVFFEDLKFNLKKGKKIVLLCGTRVKCQRFMEVLQEQEIPVRFYENSDFEPIENMVSLTHGTLHQGFEYVDNQFLVMADKELFGEDKAPSKKRFHPSQSQKIKVFADISQGDYVVHYSHGIGQYIGIEKLSVSDSHSDYLKIRYLDGDFLYVPVSQLDLVQKYIGGGDKLPKLSRLGSSEWSKAKKKVKDSLKDVATELIKIYAQREMERGYAFSKDTVWQEQMEEMFPFEETGDQLRCIEEIKKNMEAQTPMDRLLCGDVGFGKTEVALRAMFKAVMEGKQVAYLVPTTVLAYQHTMNFKERLKDFPVTIEMLSRFRSLSEQAGVIKDLKKGMVDIVVGTHRVVQKDIKFKDLGLLVVDEEQRFGVTHKEQLKKMKANVDVLTLTATPIPRTLHMSLVGIRDISVLEEPPQDRHPVQTYVLEHNQDVVREAIEREMARGGQVFYLFNTIRTIEMKMTEILNIVPDAKIQIAHGQMSRNKLEEVMQEFLEKKFDVLLCSTIIESGLDYPNVNTIIVEDADKLGLSQLYQIRGRVGRSNRIAYAYLTFKRDKILSEIAQKRLQAIRDFTELGSGFKIAMRDLEIRGAGNILGNQQHGHMDIVGYDMYMRLLSEAVTELKGNVEEKALDIEINMDLGLDAYISSEYIQNEIHKLNMYKKVAGIENNEDYRELMDEFIDRFGEVPQETRNLMDISLIRVLTKGKSIESLWIRGERVGIQFLEGVKIDFEILSRLMSQHQKRLLFNASQKPYITSKVSGLTKSEILHHIKILLQDFNNLKEE
jgi:transcription-repair coupling factor (superfamily II helicase)